MSKYDLDKIKSTVKTIMEVVILPFETVIVKGKVKLNAHSKHIIILREPTDSYSQLIVIVRTYGVLKLGSGKIDICFCYMTTKEIGGQKWQTVKLWLPMLYL